MPRRIRGDRQFAGRCNRLYGTFAFTNGTPYIAVRYRACDLIADDDPRPFGTSRQEISGIRS